MTDRNTAITALTDRAEQADHAAGNGGSEQKPLVPAANTALRLSMDVISLVCAFYVSTALAGYLSTVIFDTTPLTDQYLRESSRYNIYTLLCAVMVALFFAKGHYTSRIPWWSQVQFITSASIFILMLDGFISFALELYFSRLLIGLNWLFAFGFIIMGRQIVYRLQKNAAHWQIPTVIIGNPSAVSDVLFALNADVSTGYHPVRVFLRGRQVDDLNEDAIPKRYRAIEVSAANDDCHNFIHDNPDKFYIISLDSFRGEQREEILRALQHNGVRFAILPATGGLGLHDMEPRYFFGHEVMLLHVKRNRSPLGPLCKRTMDIAISGAALIAFAPVCAVIAVLLKLEGQGGSIFYGGERLGKNGKLFQCWKFRSMEPDSDRILQDYLARHPDQREHWEKYHKLPDDPRITTHTARFIRKSSLDEVPQIWNVFKGDMSLVGPRPILPQEREAYGETIYDYMSVKPGITGLWQVSGRNAVTFQRRIYWDSWYVRNWSLWGDVVIMLKTVPAVLMRAETS